MLSAVPKGCLHAPERYSLLNTWPSGTFPCCHTMIVSPLAFIATCGPCASWPSGLILSPTLAGCVQLADRYSLLNIWLLAVVFCFQTTTALPLCCIATCGHCASQPSGLMLSARSVGCTQLPRRYSLLNIW